MERIVGEIPGEMRRRRRAPSTCARRVGRHRRPRARHRRQRAVRPAHRRRHLHDDRRLRARPARPPRARRRHDRRRRPQAARRGARRAEGREGVAVEAGADGARHGGRRKDTAKDAERRCAGTACRYATARRARDDGSVSPRAAAAARSRSRSPTRPCRRGRPSTASRRRPPRRRRTPPSARARSRGSP